MYTANYMIEQTEANKSTAVVTTHSVRDFRPWVVYLICLSVAFVFMFFYGLNSPIHVFNTQCDYQWYMTIGHGIVTGKVPYRDLFEQKGPLIYAVFAVACWFPKPQFVIWCVEIICVSLFLFFCYRIARKFLSPWLALLVVPLMMMVLSVNRVRALNGACVEEYCLPIFAHGLLCFLNLIIDRQKGTWRRCLALGISIGLLFWTKFTMLEFYLIPLIIWLILAIKERNLLRLVRNGLIMVGGFLIVTVPIIIIFAVVGALDDLFSVYLLINVSNYNTGNEDDNYHGFWYKFIMSWFTGWYFVFMLIWGLVCFAVNYRKNKVGLVFGVTLISTWLLVGFVGAYHYYYIPMYAYVVIGVIYLVKVVSQMLQAIEVIIHRRRARVFGFTIAVVVSFFAALPFVTSIKEINRGRDDYAQLVVADIIAEYNQTAEQPATLFCYFMADCGFYNAAGIVPNLYFYAKHGFSRKGLPEMYESFDTTISEQMCDFVITYRFTYEDDQELLSTYYHPYFDNDLEASTLPFISYEPGGYLENEIVILFRN